MVADHIRESGGILNMPESLTWADPKIIPIHFRPHYIFFVLRNLNEILTLNFYASKLFVSGSF